jgi:hypothetical protein
MMNLVLKLILNFFLERIWKKIEAYIIYQKKIADMKKKVKEDIKEIKKEPDAKNRAKRMKDYLNA